MTKQTMIDTLTQHSIEFADNGHYLNVKDKYTIDGVAGFDWKPFYFECWTMKDLRRWLGY